MTGMTDPQLEHLATRLGSAEADGLDLDRIAERVSARLRAEEDISSPRRRWPWVVAVAATVALAVPGSRWLLNDGATPSARIVAVPELDVLTEAELVEVLDSLDFQAPVAEAVTATLDDLNAQQLEELLATMEG